LKRRPYGVSCGKALWHVEQGWPVWRAKLGIAETGFGANVTPAATSSNVDNKEPLKAQTAAL
jgi:hypothetical protein